MESNSQENRKQKVAIEEIVEGTIGIKLDFTRLLCFQMFFDHVLLMNELLYVLRMPNKLLYKYLNKLYEG